MNFRKKKGTIIVLHGTSSAGKTTLANALLNELDEPYEYIPMRIFHQQGINDCIQNQQKLVEKICFETCRMYYLTLNDIAWESTVYKNIFSSLSPHFDVFVKKRIQNAVDYISAAASNGKNVILETKLVSHQCFESFVKALQHYHVLFVKVFCSDDNLKIREIKRQDKAIGWAQALAQKTHLYENRKKLYDLEIDTMTNIQLCAKQIKQYIKRHKTFHAMQKNYEMIETLKKEKSHGGNDYRFTRNHNIGKKRTCSRIDTNS